MKKLMCLALVFLFVFSLAAIALHAHHDCAGDECLTCCILKLCQSLLRLLLCLSALSVLIFAYAAMHTRMRAFLNTLSLSPSTTLIALKVKLSN